MEWYISVTPTMPDGPLFEVKKIKEPHFHGHIEVQANGTLRVWRIFFFYNTMKATPASTYIFSAAEYQPLAFVTMGEN